MFKSVRCSFLVDTTLLTCSWISKQNDKTLLSRGILLHHAGYNNCLFDYNESCAHRECRTSIHFVIQLPPQSSWDINYRLHVLLNSHRSIVIQWKNTRRNMYFCTLHHVPSVSASYHNAITFICCIQPWTVWKDWIKTVECNLQYKKSLFLRVVYAARCKTVCGYFYWRVLLN